MSIFLKFPVFRWKFLWKILLRTHKFPKQLLHSNVLCNSSTLKSLNKKKLFKSLSFFLWNQNFIWLRKTLYPYKTKETIYYINHWAETVYGKFFHNKNILLILYHLREVSIFIFLFHIISIIIFILYLLNNFQQKRTLYVTEDL